MEGSPRYIDKWEKKKPNKQNKLRSNLHPRKNEMKNHRMIPGRDLPTAVKTKVWSNAQPTGNSGAESFGMGGRQKESKKQKNQRNTKNIHCLYLPETMDF